MDLGRYQPHRGADQSVEALVAPGSGAQCSLEGKKVERARLGVGPLSKQTQLSAGLRSQGSHWKARQEAKALWQE